MMIGSKLAIVLAAGMAGVVSAAAHMASGQQPASVSGRVTDEVGRGEVGVFVTARRDGATVSHTVRTGVDGSYALGPLGPGRWTVQAHGIGIEPAETVVDGVGPALPELRISRRPPGPHELPASSFLARLPDGEAKRRFVLDCTGCHVFDDRTTLPGGTPRPRAGWVEAVARMLGFAGPGSGFPVISIGREPEATADFVTASFPGPGVPALAPPPPVASTGGIVTEFAIPEPGDLPHDLAIDARGRIVITGMFTHRMYVLDPETGAFEFVPIPVQNANPRAVEIDDAGAWWVALGNPMRIARYQPGSGTWDSWGVGMYAHSIGVGPSGRVWFNGHFTRAPEQIGKVDPATGAVVTADVPAHPMAASGFGPIPYELRVTKGGTVWMSELAGNRVVSYDPARNAFRTYTMPTTFSGPRRLDVGDDGIVWIPEYANNRLARLDPASGAIEEFVLPMADAAPYVVRVDPRDGGVWIGTGAADVLLRFDPATRRFTTYPLPTRGALIRHIAIDPRNGDVWAAYGASPGIPSKVARLRVRDRASRGGD